MIGTLVVGTAIAVALHQYWQPSFGDGRIHRNEDENNESRSKGKLFDIISRQFCEDMPIACIADDDWWDFMRKTRNELHKLSLAELERVLEWHTTYKKTFAGEIGGKITEFLKK